MSNVHSTELQFAAMGTEAQIIVVDGPVRAIDRARARIEELEGRWSRFLPDSEICTLNALAGEAIEVSPDAYRLVQALGMDPAKGALRISLAHYNSEAEVEGLITALDELL